jgi:hypothetical protein
VNPPIPARQQKLELGMKTLDVKMKFTSKPTVAKVMITLFWDLQ